MNLRLFLNKYGINANKVSLLKESSDNQVFLISNGGKKILRISKRPLNDVGFELEAIKFLALHSFPTTMCLPTKDNKPSILIGKKIAVFFNFIDGVHAQITSERESYLKQVYCAGLMLGKLHSISKNYTPTLKRKRTIFTELERSLVYKEKFLKKYAGGKQYINEINNLLSWAKKQKNKSGLIHNDYRPNNIFFNSSSEVVGMIDFDWCCLGPLVKDLALGLVEWSFPDRAIEPWKEALETFLKGYNTAAPEKWRINNNLYQWIMFACLSDASTYFCDLIDGHKNEKKITKSYMYHKFKYFRGLLK